MSPILAHKMTNFRWTMCAMLFFATTINYLDRQVLSLTWNDFIAPEFGWSDSHYGLITSWFSITYAVFMLFSGKIVDAVGAKSGYMWSMGIWTTAALLHAFCGIVTCGYITNTWGVGFDGAIETLHDLAPKGLQITTVSVYIFIGCRCMLAIGQSANFPAAIKVTGEYFPMKDRAFAISIFNVGASVGALMAPLVIPVLARKYGWEMAYIIVGSIGYIWMLFWKILYHAPNASARVNLPELKYIEQDNQPDSEPIGLFKSFTYRQTWAFIFGKFMTDGVWWFFLFWTPVYIYDIYAYPTDSPMGMALIFVLYLITLLSVAGGYLPTYYVKARGMNPYAGRLKAMLIFAFIPLFGILAQPLGEISPWLVVITIGIIGAAHQSWSACIYATVGDLFPKNSVATIIGIGGMAGGFGSMLINTASGALLTYAELHGDSLTFMSYNGKSAGYMIIFCVCAVAYMIGWGIIKTLVPNFRPVVIGES